jgi:hypothetical protein
MSAEPVRHLRVISAETGEIAEDTARLIAELEQAREDRKALERELRAKRRRITELERDKARERESYEHRDRVEAVHSYWQRRTGCKGALSPARFDAVRGILEQQRLEVPANGGRARKVLAYEYPADFKRAIDGAWFDHFVKARKNGTEQHFMDLELICRDGKNFEEFMERAPKPKPRPPEPFFADWTL